MSAYEAPSPRVPVLLVTGFLGSGKTTLVNRLLKTQAFARAAVVVNEYGAVSIDHVLVAAPRARMRVIDGGCLCGHVHEEVASSLLDLHAKRDRDPDLDFDFVLIEMSGLADPVPVMQILLTDRHVTALYELKTVIAVADGVHGAEHLARHPESDQAGGGGRHHRDQQDRYRRLRAVWTRSRRGLRRSIRAPGSFASRTATFIPNKFSTHAGFDLTQRSAAARGWLNDASYAATTAPASADPAISTFALTYDEEITLPGFVLWMNLLAGFRGAGLLRVKGIVNVEGRPYAVQAVQTIVERAGAARRLAGGRRPPLAAGVHHPRHRCRAISAARSRPSASMPAAALRNMTINPADLRALSRNHRTVPHIAAAKRYRHLPPIKRASWSSDERTRTSRAGSRSPSNTSPPPA